MIYTLENEKIKITATYGVELNNLITRKILLNSMEWKWSLLEIPFSYLVSYSWEGSKGKYRVEGKEYELPQHGLARLREFKMIEKTDSRIVLNYCGMKIH